MKDHLLTIGIMTGNSLDAADVVLTAFYQNGKIEDLEFLSLPSSKELYNKLKDLRSYINEQKGDMHKVAKKYKYAEVLNFDGVLDEYTKFVATAVKELIVKAKLNPDIKTKYDLDHVDIIGFHGQTCAHLPPSQAKDGNTYTVQIGNGKKLAELTGISVAYDFRSDDLMNGGEGAPLAPKHNEHLAQALKTTGEFPIVFINGGNTSNLAPITYDNEGNTTLMGWDAGPFNHFPDMLMRTYTDKTCDVDGEIGKQGNVNQKLLKDLFDNAAVTAGDKNFLTIQPPKSSDPQWYKMIPMLKNKDISFEDKVRTVEYFSAYLTYHSLGYIPDNLVMPGHFALFGGGWKNPIITDDFKCLIKGEFFKNPILPEHKEWFEKINYRVHVNGRIAQVAPSSKFGFDGNAMEARIFADLAYCKVVGEAFTTTEITGVKEPVVCGLIELSKEVTPNLKAWLRKYKTKVTTGGRRFDKRWSRASAGWKERVELKNGKVD